MAKRFYFAGVILLIFAYFGCKGPEGPTGPSGSQSLSDPSIKPVVLLSYPSANTIGPYEGFSGSIQFRFNKLMNVPSVLRAASITSPGNDLSIDTSFIVAEGDAFSIPIRRINTTGSSNFSTTPIWAIGQSYTFSISSGAKDVNGNALENGFSMWFEPEPYFRVVKFTPVDGSKFLKVGSTISIAFNSQIEQSMFSAIHIIPGVAGYWQYLSTKNGYDSTTISYAFSTLANNTTYTISIDSTCADKSGRHIQGKTSARFSTEIYAISGTTPANNDTAVSLNQSISITASAVLDTGSVRSAFQIIPPVEGALSMGKGSNSFTFKPTHSFRANTRYTVMILPALLNNHGSRLPQQYTFSFTTGSFQVVSTTPANGAVDIPVSRYITVYCNAELDPLAIRSAFQIDPPVDGQFHFTGGSREFMFYPRAQLRGDTNYTVTISTRLRSLAGDSLLTPYVYTFRTVSFKVASTSPSDGSIGVPTSYYPQVSFTDQLDYSSALKAFSITPNTNGSLYISLNGITATFIPEHRLLSATTYTMVFDTSLQSMNGVHLKAPFTCSFTTADFTAKFADELNYSINVSMDASINVSTNEKLDTTSVRAALQISPSVSGTINYNNDSTGFYFYPTNGWAPSTVYTVTVTTALKSLNGTHLAAAISESFSTISLKVVYSYPQNGYTDIPTSSNIRIYFNAPVDSISLSQGFQIIPPVAGTFYKYSNSEFYFNLTAGLAVATQYIVTVLPTVRSMYGNTTLAQPYTFSFKTIGLSLTWSDINSLRYNVQEFQQFNFQFNASLDTSTVTDAIQLSPPIAIKLVYYDDMTGFTLIPLKPWLPDTMYTLTILTSIRSKDGVSMSNPYTTELYTLPFKVVNVSPSNGSTNVQVSSEVSIRFSSQIDTTGIGTIITCSPPISGHFKLLNEQTNLIFFPDVDLKQGASYFVNISTGLKSLAGTHLTYPYDFYFTVEPSLVSSASPQDGSTNVWTGDIIRFNFTSSLDTSTVSQAISITPPLTGFLKNYKTYFNTYSIFYADSMQANTVYTVSVSTGLKTVRGTPLSAPYIFSFKTGE
jgi:hypothetical protein